MNAVNPENFNDTLKGYLIRALKEIGASEDDRRKLFGGLHLALDLLTMEEARNVYDKYCQGLIVFHAK